MRSDTLRLLGQQLFEDIDGRIDLIVHRQADAKINPIFSIIRRRVSGRGKIGCSQ